MLEYTPGDFSILMVDDNPKNLQLLGTTLRNEGYHIEFATSGKMAINWFDKKVFDLILLDIMMPGMSGYEVCEIARQRPEYADVPIIFLTAKTEKESIVQGFKLGAQDYITKPFDLSELLARVKTQLELRSSKQQLQHINKNLENIVAERTQELQVANENLLAANDELKILDKAKTEFLQIIAHEIRTPLNGIKGSIDIMRELQESYSLGTLFNILDESVGRLEKFSILALKITQLKTGNYELDIQELPFNLLIDSVVTKNNTRINQKNLNVKKDFAKNMSINGDYELLTNCMNAIIDNAIKFSPAGGNIYLNSKVIDKNLVIEIADEGPGFSQKALDNLFTLFSPGTKHINENEGLELAMVKMVIDAHKGTIEVNNLEKGALVTLTLPINIENLTIKQ
jgi:two-component system, sensor histidine kinase and response regulator